MDTYGGFAIHGGGAFSGKDYTKVDRSAAYYARYVAKNLVAAGVCCRCLIGFSYAIGISKPISISVSTYGTNKISEEKILDIIDKVFDFSVGNIVNSLDMKHICYRELSNYGHFCRSNSSFERLDKVNEINKILSI